MFETVFNVRQLTDDLFQMLIHSLSQWSHIIKINIQNNFKIYLQVLLSKNEAYQVARYDANFINYTNAKFLFIFFRYNIHELFN